MGHIGELIWNRIPELKTNFRIPRTRYFPDYLITYPAPNSEYFFSPPGLCSAVCRGGPKFIFLLLGKYGVYIFNSKHKNQLFTEKRNVQFIIATCTHFNAISCARILRFFLFFIPFQSLMEVILFNWIFCWRNFSISFFYSSSTAYPGAYLPVPILV